MTQEEQKKIQELKEKIQRYDVQYYEKGVSEISDAEYDRLYDEYLAWEKKYPELKDMEDAPTKRVGAGEQAGSLTTLPKFTHKSPLLSIDQKAKDIDSLYDFYRKCTGIVGKTVEFIVEPKLDGITCNINYEKGKFVNAATRGNGYIGDLITAQFQNTDTKYPQTIPDNADLEIRGEAIIPYDYFKNHLLESYSNPRNAVAGIMRQVNPEEIIGKGVQVMFYDVGQHSLPLSSNDLNRLWTLPSLGFQSVPFMRATCWESLKEIVESKMDNQIQQIDGFNVLVADGYPQAVCDGLVIKVADTQLREEIGMSEKGPKWAFAFKFKPLQASTRIDHVEWQIGKSGRVTPVAVFDEISLGGTKITRATLNNYDYMQQLPVLRIRKDFIHHKPYDSWKETALFPLDKTIEDISQIQENDVLCDSQPEKNQGDLELFKVSELGSDGFYIEDFVNGGLFNGEWIPFEKNRFYFTSPKGLYSDDQIIVERSNDVIPRIVAIDYHQYRFKCKEETLEERVERNKTFLAPKVCPVCGAPLVEAYPLHYCDNPFCAAQMKGKIAHYASRDALNIVGLGESIVDTLYEKGFLTDIPSIYHLEDHRDELLQLDGWGEKKVHNLLQSIDNAKQPELWQFIYGLSIPNVGKKTAKDLAQRYQTLDAFLQATFEELQSMEDIGEITAEMILQYLQNSAFVSMIHSIISLGIQPKEVQIQGELLKGQTFVITGTLEKPRSYYREIIEGNGGKVSGSVSKKTTAVLIGIDAGSKETKARKLVADGHDILLLDSEEKIKDYLQIQ